MKEKLNFIKYLFYYSARLIFYPFMSVDKVFTDIYKRKIWDHLGSVSGDGSTPEATESLRGDLQTIFKNYNIKSILDIPCGDFTWMSKVDLKAIDYTGADIVEELIENNKTKYPDNKFIKLDICSDPLPECDLIFCRDCLVHLSNKKINYAIDNIKRSKAKYLMVTNFPESKRNRDMITGAWRPINFNITPYSFPEPLEIINEGFKLRGGRFKDKSMGLWELKEIQS